MVDMETVGDRAERRRARWPISVHRLNEPVEHVVWGTPESRLRAVGELTEQCWALAGEELPSYARRETPVRLTRLHSRNDRET
jgi:hypothetical protein